MIKLIRIIALSVLGFFILLMLLIFTSSILSNDTLSKLLDIPKNISGINYVYHLSLSTMMLVIIGISILLMILINIIITVNILKESFPIGLLYLPLCIVFGLGITYALGYSAISVLIFKGFYLFNISDIKTIFLTIYILLFFPKIILYIILYKFEPKNKIINGILYLFSLKSTRFIYIMSIFIINMFVTFDIIYLQKYFNDSLIISILTIIWMAVKYIFIDSFISNRIDPITKIIIPKYSKIENKTEKIILNGKDHEDKDKGIWICVSCSNKNPIYLVNCENCQKIFEK